MTPKPETCRKCARAGLMSGETVACMWSGWPLSVATWVIESDYHKNRMDADHAHALSCPQFLSMGDVVDAEMPARMTDGELAALAAAVFATAVGAAGANQQRAHRGESAAYVDDYLHGELALWDELARRGVTGTI